ncbi:hypothetical protein [Pararhizobium haloflavum]|uniref:hypothetical protein n=1 Tax=Pararhizobium haloflavum TaxID=2037914 RepID=UPI0012FFFC65|nr:hypothetical protein [Pararhizobium haloflavum]
MIVLSVMTVIPSHTGFVWWPVEFDCEDIDEVFEELDGAGCIKGLKYEGERRNSRTLHVTRKVPMILGVNSFISITPLHQTLLDATDPHREPVLIESAA